MSLATRRVIVPLNGEARNLTVARRSRRLRASVILPAGKPPGRIPRILSLAHSWNLKNVRTLNLCQSELSVRLGSRMRPALDAGGLPPERKQYHQEAVNLRAALALSSILLAVQPSFGQSPGVWTEGDVVSHVWELDNGGGSRAYMALPQPSRVFGPGSGAAWGGRIEADSTLSDWFSVEYQGRTADGIRLVVREGRATASQLRSFSTKNRECSLADSPVPPAVCRARAIMWGLLDGGGAFGGQGTAVLLRVPPFRLALKLGGAGSTPSPVLVLVFEESPSSGVSVMLRHP